MSTRIYLLLLASAFGSSTEAAEILWTNVAGGNWHAAANWNPNQVPGADDAVIITNAGNYTVTLSANASLGSLLLGGPDGAQALTITAVGVTVNGAARIDTNGLIAISGGNLFCSGNLAIDGVVNVFGGSFSGSSEIGVRPAGQFLFGGDISLGGKAVRNSGRLIWASGNITDVSSIVNSSNGVVDVLISATNELYGIGGDFINAGLVRRTAGTSTARFNLPFYNQGSVQVQSGILHLMQGAAQTGGFTVASNATVHFGASPGWTFEFRDTSSVTGSGNVTFQQASVDLNGTFNIAGRTTILGGTVNFSTGCVLTNAPLTIQGATANFNTGRMLWPSTLTMGGTLQGTDSITVLDAFVFQSSAMLRTTGSINAKAGFSLIFPADLNMFSGTLNNAAGAALLAGNIRLWSNSVMNNFTGATFHCANGFIGESGTSARFNNLGYLLKSGTAATRIAVPFYNEGHIDVDQGNLLLSGGGVHSGSIRIATGTSLTLSEGSTGLLYTLSSNSLINGGGNIVVTSSVTSLGNVAVGGNVTIMKGTSDVLGTYTNGGILAISNGVVNFDTGETLRIQRLILSGGTLGGADPIVVTGPMTWSSGVLRSGSGVSANGGLTMSGSTLLLEGATLNNAGIANWTGGVILTGGGSVISNAPSGIFNVTFDGQTFAGFGGSRRFLNAGVVRKTGGSGTSVISDAFYNTGTIEVLVGDLAFGSTFVQSAGASLLRGGNLAASGPFQLLGGVLAGSGTVSANVVNSGRIAPGESAGLLRINGNYTQNNDGQLQVELGGSAPGSNLDQLQVSGNASLAGTLNVALIGGFRPAFADTFRVLTFASRSGDFAVFNDSTGSDLRRLYDGSGLTLAASNSSPVLLVTRQPGQPEIVISWPNGVTGYRLQSATNVADVDWETVPSTDTNRVVLPATSARRFFRLINP